MDREALRRFLEQGPERDPEPLFPVSQRAGQMLQALVRRRIENPDAPPVTREDLTTPRRFMDVVATSVPSYESRPDLRKRGLDDPAQQTRQYAAEIPSPVQGPSEPPQVQGPPRPIVDPRAQVPVMPGVAGPPAPAKQADPNAPAADPWVVYIDDWLTQPIETREAPKDRNGVPLPNWDTMTDDQKQSISESLEAVAHPADDYLGVPVDDAVRAVWESPPVQTVVEVLSIPGQETQEEVAQATYYMITHDGELPRDLTEPGTYIAHWLSTAEYDPLEDPNMGFGRIAPPGFEGDWDSLSDDEKRAVLIDNAGGNALSQLTVLNYLQDNDDEATWAAAAAAYESGGAEGLLSWYQQEVGPWWTAASGAFLDPLNLLPIAGAMGRLVGRTGTARATENIIQTGQVGARAKFEMNLGKVLASPQDFLTEGANRLYQRITPRFLRTAGERQERIDRVENVEEAADLARRQGRVPTDARQAFEAEVAATKEAWYAEREAARARAQAKWDAQYKPIRLQYERQEREAARELDTQIRRSKKEADQLEARRQRQDANRRRQEEQLRRQQEADRVRAEKQAEAREAAAEREAERILRGQIAEANRKQERLQNARQIYDDLVADHEQNLRQIQIEQQRKTRTANRDAETQTRIDRENIAFERRVRNLLQRQKTNRVDDAELADIRAGRPVAETAAVTADDVAAEIARQRQLEELTTLDETVPQVEAAEVRVEDVTPLREADPEDVPVRTEPPDPAAPLDMKAVTARRAAWMNERQQEANRARAAGRSPQPNEAMAAIRAEVEAMGGVLPSTNLGFLDPMYLAKNATAAEPHSLASYVAFVEGPLDPAAARAFWDEYEPAALHYITQDKRAQRAAMAATPGKGVDEAETVQRAFLRAQLAHDQEVAFSNAFGRPPAIAPKPKFAGDDVRQALVDYVVGDAAQHERAAGVINRALRDGYSDAGEVPLDMMLPELQDMRQAVTGEPGIPLAAAPPEAVAAAETVAQSVARNQIVDRQAATAFQDLITEAAALPDHVPGQQVTHTFRYGPADELTDDLPHLMEHALHGTKDEVVYVDGQWQRARIGTGTEARNELRQRSAKMRDLDADNPITSVVVDELKRERLRIYGRTADSLSPSKIKTKAWQQRLAAEGAKIEDTATATTSLAERVRQPAVTGDEAQEAIGRLNQAGPNWTSENDFPWIMPRETNTQYDLMSASWDDLQARREELYRVANRDPLEAGGPTTNQIGEARREVQAIENELNDRDWNNSRFGVDHGGVGAHLLPEYEERLRAFLGSLTPVKQGKSAWTIGDSVDQEFLPPAYRGQYPRKRDAEGAIESFYAEYPQFRPGARSESVPPAGWYDPIVVPAKAADRKKLVADSRTYQNVPIQDLRDRIMGASLRGDYLGLEDESMLVNALLHELHVRNWLKDKNAIDIPLPFDAAANDVTTALRHYGVDQENLSSVEIAGDIFQSVGETGYVTRATIDAHVRSLAGEGLSSGSGIGFIYSPKQAAQDMLDAQRRAFFGFNDRLFDRLNPTTIFDDAPPLVDNQWDDALRQGKLTKRERQRFNERVEITIKERGKAPVQRSVNFHERVQEQYQAILERRAKKDFVRLNPKKELSEDEIRAALEKVDQVAAESWDEAISKTEEEFRRSISGSDIERGRREEILRLAGKGHGALQNFYRQTSQFNPVTGPRKWITDTVTNFYVAAQFGEIGALRNFGRLQYTLARYGVDVPIEQIAPDVFMSLTKTGKTLPREFQEQALVARTQVESLDPLSGKPQVLFSTTVGEIGSRLIPGFRYVNPTKLMAAEWTRKLRTAGDLAIRQSVFVNIYDKELIFARYRFMRRAQEYAQKTGDTTLLRDIGQLGPHFSVDDLKPVLDKHWISDQTLLRRWAEELDDTWHTAKKKTQDMYFDYRKSKVDEKLGKIFMFHYWMTRNAVQQTKFLLAHPGLALAYYNLWGAIKETEFPDAPEWFDTFLTFGSEQGMYGMLDIMSIPAAFLSMATLFEKRDFNETYFDNLVERTGLYLSPVIRTPLAAIGLTKLIGDPTATLPARRAIVRTLDWLKANKKLGLEPDITDDWIDQRVRDLMNWSSSKFDKWIPFGGALDRPDYIDVEKRNVRKIMVDNYTAEHGPVREWTKEERDTFDEALIALDAGVPNPIVERALETRAEVNFTDTILQAVAPTYGTVRYGPLDTSYATEAAAFDKLDTGETLTDADQEQLDQAELSRGADPESIALRGGIAEWYGVGGEWESFLNQGRNIFMFPEDLPDDATTQIGDQTVSARQLKRMTFEQRAEVAEAWVSYVGNLYGMDAASDLKRFDKERDEVKLANPDVADFLEYRSWILNQKSIRQVRLELEKAPGDTEFKKAIARERRQLQDAGLSPAQVDAGLDRWMSTESAYAAVIGLRYAGDDAAGSAAYQPGLYPWRVEETEFEDRSEGSSSQIPGVRFVEQFSQPRSGSLIARYLLKP